MLNLMQIKCFMLDMDGTLYLGNQLFEGTKPFLAMLRQKGYEYLFLTNNSSKSTEQYLQKLHKMGLDATEDRVLCSSYVAAQYMKEYFSGKRVYVLGNRFLKEELQEHGVSVTEDDAEAVLIGFDTTLVYDQLFRACNYIKQGLPYIATHPDLNCPFENGRFLPDVGSTIAFIKASTGRVPDKILGKPSEYLITCVKRRLNLTNSQLCMVGDRLQTDISMGQYGIATVLLLSGVTKEKDAKRSRIKADLTLDKIDSLTDYMLSNL